MLGSFHADHVKFDAAPDGSSVVLIETFEVFPELKFGPIALDIPCSSWKLVSNDKQGG